VRESLHQRRKHGGTFEDGQAQVSLAVHGRELQEKGACQLCPAHRIIAEDKEGSYLSDQGVNLANPLGVGSVDTLKLVWLKPGEYPRQPGLHR
jgi:hypothetical protein